MAKRARIAAWQMEDADRLSKLWEKLKPMSQEQFAHYYFDEATQGLIWQYLNGHIPLNLEAAVKFAKGLNVKITDFSPTIAEQVLRAVPCVANEQQLEPVVRQAMPQYSIRKSLQEQNAPIRVREGGREMPRHGALSRSRNRDTDRK